MRRADDAAGTGTREDRAAERRAKLAGLQAWMREAGAERVVVDFDGADDNGAIDQIEAFRTAEPSPGHDDEEPETPSWRADLGYGGSYEEQAEPIPEERWKEASDVAWSALREAHDYWWEGAGGSGRMTIPARGTKLDVDIEKRVITRHRHVYTHDDAGAPAAD